MINMTTGGSTGTIMFQVAAEAEKRGHEVFTYSPAELNKSAGSADNPGNGKHFFYSKRIERKADNIIGRVLGCNGMTSWFGTARLIRSLRRNRVELVHLHNLHSYCINLRMLFRYIKKNNLHVVWTLHDCWTFTGHCPHYVMAGCDKWKTQCFHCPQLHEYPQCKVDNSRYQYRFKKKTFSGVSSMTLVTPSRWLAEQVKESFLKRYPVKVIHNGIDPEVFSPLPSDFREKHGLEDKRLILGVASSWGEKKGLDMFIRLAEKMPEDWHIVMAGVSDSLAGQLPDNITAISKTENRRALAEMYTAADVFVNPTREDTFPTVNLEALACGTPVITFRTGGSPECIDATCGIVVPPNDFDSLWAALSDVLSKKRFSPECCRERALLFDSNHQYKEYIALYESFMTNRQ